ncbi:conserved hypothetical protein [Cyanobium sp. PCC 7001]|uniref:hypothetical protein n=1 Tax=Cyanobium sp. PCC 7001 TaxID=180281 RepID=UPI000180552A|nr:hypothetical protein [Cyanobium sp. PCC 7001]EDY38135.1 conserved hypothetical protein [Cyanobium sp. PCC 7001]
MRQLLLLPLLAPLLAVVLIGAVNPRPAVALRLLTWTSPALPIGVWLMLAAAGGAGISAVGTALALSTGGERELQRQVRRPVTPRTDVGRPEPGADTGTDFDLGWEPPRPEHRSAAGAGPAAAGPTRAAGESSPTVAVPYRVIRRPAAGAAPPPAAAPTAAPPTAAPAEAGVAAGEGWGTPLGEGW